MTSGDGRLGVNVWWTVPSLVKNGEQAQADLKKNGFEGEDMPLPTRRAEVSRAAYSFQNRMGKSNRRVTEKAMDNSGSVVYGILEREQEAVDTVGFAQSTTIRLNKDSGVVTAVGALAGDVMKAVQDYTGKVTDEDVRGFLRRVVRLCRGIAKRPTGGIYFIPDVNMGVMMSAKQALADMDCGARIYVERVMDGQQERENVWGSVEEDVKSQIEETLASVERIEKRASSITGQQAKLEELGELVEVYKSLLGEEAKFEAVAEDIEAAVKTVAAKMQKLQGTASAPDKGPGPGKGKAPAVGGSKVVEAAVAVLSEAGKPMEAKALFDAAVVKGLYVSDAKDPFTSFFSVLGKAVGKGEKRVARVGKVWTMAA